MDLVSGLITLTILIFSAILHEIAHGFVAYRLGDPTAKIMGRLTLNPKSHIDPIMSILLPLMLIVSGSPVIFGAAKPVPVDPFNLRDGRRDMAIVALSGPLTNVAVAILASLLLNLLGQTALAPLFYVAATINLLLAIFNLLPIPPLDGSKVFSLLLPEKEANAYLSLGSIGMFIIFFLLLFPLGGFSLGRFVFQLLQFSTKILGL
ncbi:MAG: site-2 protease family protein [Candidatus Levybacteria bacterium]|nr:site-2 protease family protein [Candidatus Levybacteria bacterium]